MIGATVARETGLKVGDEFQPTHGAGPDAHQHDPFTVLGVLKPTGTPNDRGLFINMEGFYLIPEHAKPLDDDDAGRGTPRTSTSTTTTEHADEQHDRTNTHDEHADDEQATEHDEATNSRSEHEHGR